MSVLTKGEYQCRVSSVLNRDVKSFGKKHLFDGKDDTCWNSDQGSPQWISISLTEPAEISSFKIQFQGGFVGMNCTVELGDGSEGFTLSEDFYPEDINSLQTFILKTASVAKVIKFLFRKSTDFFGRIVVYKLEIFGSGR